MTCTIPATAMGQRVIADARNLCTSRQEHVQGVDQALQELSDLGEPTGENLAKMSLDFMIWDWSE